jgi:cytochrome c-type biogenesis protein CcmH/NrfG
MRKQAWAFLAVGFILGFGVLYTWTKQRAPQIVRAMPLPVDTSIPTQAQTSAPEPAPPPVDMARVQQLKTAIQNDPKNFEALVELGNIQFDQRNFKDCVDLYAKALQVRPDDINVRTDLGTALFYDNQIDAAIVEFKKTLEVNPRYAQALFNLGVAMLHGKKDPQAALQYWEKMVELNPDDPQVNLIRQQIQVLKDQQKIQ